MFLRDPAAGPTRSERARRLMMGDIARVADGEVDLAIEVVGSAPIERLDIYDGLDLIETVRPYGAGDLGARVRLVYEGAEYRGRARTTTWDGSLAIEGNRILRTAVINNWNLDRGIQSQDATSLDLEGRDDRQLRRHRPVAGAARRGGSPSRPRRCRARRRLRSSASSRACSRPAAWSAPSSCSACPRSMTRARAWRCAGAIKLRATGDTRLYIRVQQEDGHRMWSSPIYLFR